MIRLDYEIIANIIEPGSRVLDLGCGDGELLALLKEKNNALLQVLRSMIRKWSVHLAVGCLWRKAILIPI